MTDDLHNLIEALRNELQQYGEMLARLDQQQDLAAERGGDGWNESLAAIQEQSATIQAARRCRQEWQQKLARALQQPEHSSLTLLIPRLPEHYRPLIGALVQENHELLQRVTDRAGHHRHMLQRSLEILQSFVASLSPPTLTDTPCRADATLADVSPDPSRLEAVA